MSKGKTHAARYYMETVLNRLADYPKELADVINFQDEDGETALTMAARCRSKRLVKLLIDHGADPKLVNRDGKSTEDYILEDERFRSSPGPISRVSGMSFRNAQAAYSLPVAPPIPMGNDRLPLHYSVSGQKAGTKCVNEITSMLDTLAASFDRELQDKERDMNQAHALLQNIQQEILESHRAVNQLKTQAEGLQLAKGMLSELESQLSDKMGKRYRLGWEKWIKDEENREKLIRDAAEGELRITPSTVPYRTDVDIDGEASAESGSRDKGKGKRKALPQKEDLTDLLALYADVSNSEDAIKAVSEAMREDLGHSRKRRKELFDQLIAFQAEAGTGGRMAEYRRLIGAGCGGVPPSEVDNVIGMLLETLESEEPSMATGAWTGTKAGPMPAG
ncbi:hypothetical protein JVU11DRAFT_1841 [Chiua virens]|nr:hypothetical protein JVU11DRAFT_1841 [Chiua virens]